MRQKIKFLMGIILLIILLVSSLSYFLLKQGQWGKAPAGERLLRIQQSPNFRDGKFQNQSPTPQLTEGYSMIQVGFEYFFNSVPNKIPTDSLPSHKTDLFKLDHDEDVLIWFGHSSYFIQLNGKKFLVDPVFSGNASPLPGFNPAFKGSDIYTVEEIPAIDYLLITHDHYDHLDYQTILKLEPKVAKVICGLGVGAHFESWGFGPEKVIEKDWYDSLRIDSQTQIHFWPARHFSGRFLSPNNTLWGAFALISTDKRIFLGGDSGYDKHFKEAGTQLGPFDLAILDNGQYNEAWRLIHCLPDEVLQAVDDLHATRLFPVHSAKFKMANHPWDEPLRRISDLDGSSPIHLVTPMIGEKVLLNDEHQRFSRWWLGVK
jgi:L-ascorbate metabolism protein UlaG (beta-lactamase superfamily)